MRLTREQIKAVYDLGPEAVITLVESLIDQIEQLTQRVEKLENERSLTSKNSSKPPSSDRVRPKSLRKKSGRKPGGQSGHEGHHLSTVSTPDAVLYHRATQCQHCRASLDGVAHEVAERRQVIQWPVVRAHVIEHQVQRCTCAGCGRPNRGSFPEGVSGRVSYGPRLRAFVLYLNQYQLLPYDRTRELMADLLGVKVSTGALAAMVSQASEEIEPLVKSIASQLKQEPVIHLDETGFYVDQKRQWLHVASSDRLTYYMQHPGRGKAAIDAMGVLPKYKGTAIHDGHRPYWHYDQCTHGLCNVHHLRSLRFIEERYKQNWASRLKRLLVFVKKTKDPPCDRVVRLYRQIIARGLRIHPAQQRKPGKKRGPVKQSKARNLLLYLQQHESAVLRFMTDPDVPFDNNLAERDIRMMKVKQKISGAFRSQAGATAFCRIRSYISTLKKQGLDLLDALVAIFDPNIDFPDLATE